MKALNTLFWLFLLYWMGSLALHRVVFSESSIVNTAATEYKEDLSLREMVAHSAKYDGIQMTISVRVIETGDVFWDFARCNSFLVSDGSARIRVFTSGPTPMPGEQVKLQCSFKQVANGVLIKNWCLLRETDATMRIWSDESTPPIEYGSDENPSFSI